MPEFTGLGVALATPFTSDGRLDLPALKNLVRYVGSGGADFLVPLGSTGEAATLSDRERDAVIATVAEGAGNLPVVVGTGSNDTRQAAIWTRRARQLGAHGALVVTPYYSKPTPDGIVAHFTAVADAAPDFPLIAYNVPSRTGINLAVTTLARLWELPQVVALKESSGDLRQIREIGRQLPEGKILLAGDDALAAQSIAYGAKGLVSVLGNAFPWAAKDLVTAALDGRTEDLRRLQKKWLPVMRALFLESNPIPLKALLAQLGLSGNFLRLPLVPASAATSEALALAWRKALPQQASKRRSA